MKNIHKSFPGVRALRGVDFHLNKGEIHALMGENGAGKSTLIKVLTGVYSKDEGQIFIDGNDKAVSIHSPQEAQKLGISTVYQEIITNQKRKPPRFCFLSGLTKFAGSLLLLACFRLSAFGREDFFVFVKADIRFAFFDELSALFVNIFSNCFNQSFSSFTCYSRNRKHRNICTECFTVLIHDIGSFIFRNQIHLVKNNPARFISQSRIKLSQFFNDGAGGRNSCLPKCSSVE